MFSMLDTDDDNEISIEGAVDFVRRSGNAKFTPTLESIRATYDDNDNGRIDLQEFTFMVSDM
jgi:Ca2+-binding EF-hand superfamily protein